MNSSVPVLAAAGNVTEPAKAIPPDTLRRHAIQGGAVTFAAQGIRVGLNVVSTVLLARLLTPTDYGHVAMVTAVTGFVEILKDGGLSLATVQREQITTEQISALFWLNAALGALLALVSIAISPLVAHFYHESALAPLTAAIGVSFLIGGLAVQHQAMLRRELRFTALAVIDVVSMLTGIVLAVGLAWLGAGSWALVGMTVGSLAFSTIASWLLMPLRPGPIRSAAGILPMLKFGGSILVVRFVHSFIRNTPNMLLGWYWGAVAAGIYQRAYTLLMFAVDQIQGPVASVAFSPLARLQNDPERLKRFFLSAYGIIVSALLPVMITCAVYADEIVTILLGPQWTEAAHVFRWLALAGLFISLNHPQGIILFALGRGRLAIRIVVLDATGMMVAYFSGLHFGPRGIAVAFFVAKLILWLPITLVSLQTTPISFRELIESIRAPIIVTAIAGIIGALLKLELVAHLAPAPLGIIGAATTLLVYGVGLLFGARQWKFYRSLVDEFRTRPAAT